MEKINFIYNSFTTVIQCKEDDKLSVICERYLNKILKKKEELIFIYNGETLNQKSMNLTYHQMAKKLDKGKNICILVNDSMGKKEEKKNIIKSKEILCPECNESIRMNISNYKIRLYNCKNRHCKENISFKEFDNMLNIDISKIICDICQKNNKGDSHDNLFYRCSNCKQNLCVVCKSKHSKSHNILDYDIRNYKCEFHGEQYISYCKKCYMNICQLCENNHETHNIESYRKLISDKDKKKDELNNLGKIINEMKIHLNEIINRINTVIKNIEIYYNISSNYINSYDIKNRNYELLMNIKELINKDIINDINYINKNEDLNNRFNKIFEIYDKIKYEPKIIDISSKRSFNDNSVQLEENHIAPKNAQQPQSKIEKDTSNRESNTQNVSSKPSINDNSTRSKKVSFAPQNLSKIEKESLVKETKSLNTSSKPSKIDNSIKLGDGGSTSKTSQTQSRKEQESTLKGSKSQKDLSNPPINDNSVKSGGGKFDAILEIFQPKMKQESSDKESKSKPKSTSSKSAINDNQINSRSSTFNDLSALIQKEKNQEPTEKESKNKETSCKQSKNDNSVKSGDTFKSKIAFLQAELDRQKK